MPAKEKFSAQINGGMVIMGNNLELWCVSRKFIWEKWMHYTSHRIFRSVSIFVRECKVFLFLFFLTRVSGPIKGWRFEEIVLCQAFIAISHGIMVIFFTGVRDFKLSNGKFEACYLKPKGLLWQILLGDVDWFAVAGHITLGIMLFSIGFVGCKLQLTGVDVLFFLLNIVGGVLIRAAFRLAGSGIKCMTNDAVNFNGSASGYMSFFLKFPLSWYSSGLLSFFTYVLPWGFVSLYPVLQLLGKDVGTPEILNYLSLPVGIVTYLIAYLIWRIGLKVYKY